MTILWLIALTILVCLQGAMIRSAIKEIEAIKSWYPFCEIMTMRIPKTKGGDTE